MEGHIYCNFNFQLLFIYIAHLITKFFCPKCSTVIALHYGLALYTFCTLHNLSSLVAHPGILWIQKHCSLHSIHAIHSKSSVVCSILVCRLAHTLYLHVRYFGIDPLVCITTCPSLDVYSHRGIWRHHVRPFHVSCPFISDLNVN